jgi:hypothetical protein
MSTTSPTSFQDSDFDGAVCIPNISTAERRKRLRFGIIALAVTLAVLVVLMATGVSRWWRLPLFVLFATAATCYFEWRDKTCVSLSARQSRKLGDKEEKIADRRELAQVKRQARRVYMEGVLVAIVLTLLAIALPVL